MQQLSEYLVFFFVVLPSFFYAGYIIWTRQQMQCWKHHAGLLLMIVGVLHSLLTMPMVWPAWVDIAHSGFLHTVGEDVNRNTAFWLFFFGIVLFVLGYACYWFQKTFDTLLPAGLAWVLLVFGLMGLFDPNSGCWIFISLGVFGLMAHHKDKREVQNAAQ